MSDHIIIKLKKSLIGLPKKHKDIVNGLGLKKLNQVVQRQNTPELHGMINKVGHLLSVSK